jgi:hypothetical protein
MNSKPLPVLLVAALILSNLPLVFGQQAGSNNWSLVQGIRTDSKLLVTLKKGSDIKGRMIEATDTTLTIDRDGKPFSIARADVRQVYVTSGKAEKGKWSLIGAGVGAGAGAGIGAIKYSPDSDDSEIYVGMGLLIGAGVGAVSGLVFGQSKRDRVLVYNAF